MATQEVRDRSESRRLGQIVEAARDLLEREGWEAVSMRRVAAQVGIKAPSLYKHLPDKAALAAALISTGFGEQAVALEAARSSPQAIESGERLAVLAYAYRDFARRHPHLYRLMTQGSLPRERLAPGVEDRVAAPLVEALAGDIDAARAAWAFAHGMVLLELDQRFPEGADLDAAWWSGIEALQSGR
ncbi:MAG: TetR/AcrR family transcriptional regulator [Candidatus Dormibacteraeota bacterium]|nr:TetR/AcrR family transcriptional regulator [Candidatus Dormibacteraeota bacterium]